MEFLASLQIFREGHGAAGLGAGVGCGGTRRAVHRLQ